MSITTEELKEILKASVDISGISASNGMTFDAHQFVISVIGELKESRKEIRVAIDGAKPEDLINNESIADALRSYLDDEYKPKVDPDTIRSNEPNSYDKIYTESLKGANVDWSTNNKEWIDTGIIDKDSDGEKFKMTPLEKEIANYSSNGTFNYNPEMKCFETMIDNGCKFLFSWEPSPKEYGSHIEEFKNCLHNAKFSVRPSAFMALKKQMEAGYG